MRKYCTFVAEKHTNQPLPVDHWCGKYHCMKNTLFPRLCGLVLLSICGFFSVSMDAAPKLYSAYIENVQVNTADVYVSASEGTDRFKCRMIRTNLDHTFWVKPDENGKFTLKGMNQCTAHTLEIWAVDEDVADSISDNSITLSYSTLGDAIDLYLRGGMNGWGTNLPFRYTTTSGIYAVTTKIVAGTYEYQVANYSWSSQSAHRYITVSEEKYVTFCARSIENFISTADSLYMAGTVVNPEMSETPAWDVSNAAVCTWVGMQAVWKGAINRNGEYKFIKHTSNADIWGADVYGSNQSISGISSTASFAKFTFDLPTLSWKWEELDDLCTTTGYEKSSTYEYSLSLYRNAANNALQVSASNIQTATPTAVKFYCYDYDSADNDYSVSLEALSTGSKTFVGSIPFSYLRPNSNNTICYAAELTYSSGDVVHSPKAFYSLNGACTTDTLFLYHHGQSETGGVEEYRSGRIVQPIVYRRKFKPGYWETLCLPFEVYDIRVYDTDDKQEYCLHPQAVNGVDTLDGEFWLRSFTGENVEAANVENSWTTPAKDYTFMPERNTPYIIMFPDEDNYYDDKYILFYAEGFQTIESEFSPSRPTENDVYTYAGNNTLQPQTITNAYLLASGSEYFDGTAEGSGTLYPFEAALFATQQTVAKMPRMRINRRQDTPTNLIPTTSTTEGEVYTLWGNRVGAFVSEGDYVVLTHSLPAGLYLVRTGNTTTKVCLSK